MAKPKTKTQIIDGIAKVADINKKQAKAALEALAAMAYKGAKDGFTIPGLGKLGGAATRRRARRSG